jgi:hypothetical protein
MRSGMRRSEPMRDAADVMVVLSRGSWVVGAERGNDAGMCHA